MDIMGTDKDAALFADCKWTNEKVDLGVLETLVERGRLFHHKQKYFYLFGQKRLYKGLHEQGGGNGQYNAGCLQ